MFIEGGDDPKTLGSRPTNETIKAIDVANTSNFTRANIMKVGKACLCVGETQGTM